MKKVFIVLLVLLSEIGYGQDLPRILNPRDTAIATVPLWIQTLKSEVDQRMECKQLKEKLEAYVKKTGEIERLQGEIDHKGEQKEALLDAGADKYEHTIKLLSEEITLCSQTIESVEGQRAKLEKQIAKLSRTNRGWKRTAIGEGVILLAGLLLLL